MANTVWVNLYYDNQDLLVDCSSDLPTYAKAIKDAKDWLKDNVGSVVTEQRTEVADITRKIVPTVRKRK